MKRLLARILRRWADKLEPPFSVPPSEVGRNSVIYTMHDGKIIEYPPPGEP